MAQKENEKMFPAMVWLRHSDRPGIGVNHMENMNSSRFASMVRTDGIMINGLFSWYTLRLFVEIKDRLNTTI